MDHEPARAMTRQQSQLRVTSIPFSKFPGQSKLFLDYLRDPLSLGRYYPNAVASPRDSAVHASHVLASYSTDRNDLADILRRQNTALGAGRLTFDNIERLRSADCVAVVTGQQAGLFTGPLYTIYKALSAVRLAAELSASGLNAVPVFWVASEDHDFAEVSHAYVLDGGAPVKIEYAPRGYTPDVSVGAIPIDESIDEIFRALASALPSTEFTSDVVAMARDAYQPGTGFAVGFGRAIQALLRSCGIVVIDPLYEEVKRLSAPIYSAIAANAPAIVDAIRARNSELEASGYLAQVLVEDDYFPLFWHDDEGRRLALRRVDADRYRVKGTNVEFSLSELVELATSEPARFSPGVMARPVVQDFLLPTLCYFGGGAEIAYFAQNSEAYRVLGRPVTPIFHRQSFTVVATRYRRTLDRLELELPDLFAGKDQIRLNSANSEFWQDTGRVFAESEEHINAELHRIDGRLSEIDVTLAANFAQRRRKILYHLAAMKDKTLLAEARRSDTLGRQIDALYAALLPNGGLQERSLSVFSFINKYGPGFIDWLYDSIDLDDPQHRVVDL